jgi:hypothetical protein
VWVHYEKHYEQFRDPYEDLPKYLTMHLTPKDAHGHVEYASRREAEADLARALAQTQNAPAS